MPNERVNNSS